ncbi:MAG: hypothetical protein JJ971_03850 [Balneolaceae bacterium]|nr:hypothetical protein [Balneolaceae bacterium]MBO6545506.1 hypothetical protein [Balneolaceae bacterium]MBO6646902.1 hypothetical protein [Balneolaceae bacterium]
MGKLTDDEIRLLIKRASVFQKFNEQSPHKNSVFNEEDYQTLFEIADNLNLDRQHIKEALIEHQGIETEDPIKVDTGNQTDVHVTAHANGSIDGSVLNEIRANLEYHFNTVGKITRRNKKIFWNATPSGPSRLFSITNSPELEISQKDNRVKFSLRQNLSSLNKFFFFPAFAVFISFMMLAAVIFDQVTGDGRIPMTILPGFFLTASYFFSRFIKKRKLRRKEKLVELLGTFQQIIERHFLAGKSENKSRERIKIPDLDDIEVEEEVTLGEKAKS